MEQENNNAESEEKKSNVFVWISVVLGALLIAGIFYFMGQNNGEEAVVAPPIETSPPTVVVPPIEQEPESSPELSKKSCKSDSDCVPDKCCHANDVVNKEYAPSCEDVMCTMSCETVLDCGQAEPVCNAGMCDIGEK